METPEPLPENIGTHEGRELELLLAGTKPLAMLSNEPTMNFYQDESAFQPHVDAGTIKRFFFTRPDGLVEYIYYCLPTEEWRVKLMETMRSLWSQPGHGGYTVDDYNRIEGHLLGYTKAEIEAFITNWNRPR